jgi:hypothetical protein
MEAAKDARQLALDSEGLPPVSREVDVSHGYGKRRYTEKLTTTLVGVPDLMTCDWFKPQGSKANGTTKKNYEQIPSLLLSNNIRQILGSPQTIQKDLT